MKKKLFFTLLAMVCALSCLFGMAACGEPASGPIQATVAESEYVQQVDFLQKSDSGEWYNVKDLKSGKETQIKISLNAKYNLGDLKIAVDGAELETTLTQNVRLAESAVFTPKADFAVTFTGEAEHRKTNLTLSVYCPDEAWMSAYEELVYIEVLVNGNPVQPFVGATGNAITYKQFAELVKTNFVIALNSYVDHVDFTVYTASADISVANFISFFSADVENEKWEKYEISGNKGKHLSFDVEHTDHGLKITVRAVKPAQ